MRPDYTFYIRSGFVFWRRLDVIRNRYYPGIINDVWYSRVGNTVARRTNKIEMLSFLHGLSYGKQ